MLDIPVVPTAIVALLSLFAPYAIALVNQPWWSSRWKKVISILVSVAIAAVALAIYYAATGDPLPQWWQLLILAVVVTQASYSLVTKSSAKQLEVATSPKDMSTSADGTPKVTGL